MTSSSSQQIFETLARGGDGSLVPFNLTLYTQNKQSVYLGRFGDFNNLVRSPIGPDILIDGPSDIGYPDNGVGCPSLMFHLGNFEIASDGGSLDANFTVLACTQMIQQVDTNVTFSNLALDIDPAEPPTPIESTAQFINNGTANSYAREFQLTYNINSEFIAYNDSLGAFYGTVVHGRNGTPVEELVGPENVDKLLGVTNHLYGQYMAQAISTNMRNASSVSVNDDHAINDSVIIQSTYRITQNKTSKIVLQVLLSAISVSALLAWIFSGSTKDLLYHNPCSIAGVASLLPGSELWAPGFLPPGAPCLSDQELMKEKTFDGWLFSLGWWNDNGERAQEQSRRFGIDVGKPDAR